MTDVRKTKDVPGYQQRALSSGRATTGDEARTRKEYRQSVSPVRPPTRDEVEARLRATSESISARLEVLQSEMGIDGEAVKDFASRPFVSVFLALGAGYAIGKLLGSLARDSGDEGSALADLITDEVVHALDGNEPVHDAVQRVLAAVGHKQSARAESAGLFRWMAGSILRAAVGQSIKEVSRRFTSHESE